jgi:hypothetical protein
LSFLAGALLLAARAAPPALGDHAAMSRALCTAVVEEAGRGARYKRYGYAKPYGGPLF